MQASQPLPPFKGHTASIQGLPLFSPFGRRLDHHLSLLVPGLLVPLLALEWHPHLPIPLPSSPLRHPPHHQPKIRYHLAEGHPLRSFEPCQYSDSDSQRRHPLLTKNSHDLVPFLELKPYLEQENTDLAALASPRLFATHMPYSSLPQSVRDSTCKLVYLGRNPKDTFVSLWHFANKLRPKGRGQMPIQECLDKFCRGLSPYGPYWDHVLGYHKVSLEKPEKVLFLMYEEMKEDLHAQVRRLADFVGCPFSEEELRDGTVEGILRMCSFDSLSALEVNKSGKTSNGEENKWFFRRGEVGDWANHMSAEMGERIDGAMEEKLHGSGLKL